MVPSTLLSFPPFQCPLFLFHFLVSKLFSSICIPQPQLTDPVFHLQKKVFSLALQEDLWFTVLLFIRSNVPCSTLISHLCCKIRAIHTGFIALQEPGSSKVLFSKGTWQEGFNDFSEFCGYSKYLAYGPLFLARENSILFYICFSAFKYAAPPIPKTGGHSEHSQHGSRYSQTGSQQL